MVVGDRLELGREERAQLVCGELAPLAVAVDELAREALLGALPLVAHLLERADGEEAVAASRGARRVRVRVGEGGRGGCGARA